jgi:hypothetical protein
MSKSFFLITVFLLSINPISFGATPNFIFSSEASNGKVSSPLHSDSSSAFNIQQFAPSALLNRGQLEVKTFHNLYTQTAFFEKQLKRVKSNGRTTYYTGIHQFLYGYSSNINIGFEFWHKGVLAHQRNDLPFQLVGFNQTNSRNELTYAGPKIKISPIKRIPRFAIQSTLLLPLIDDPEGRTADAGSQSLFLETNRTLWINQLLYDRMLGEDFQLFMQFSQWVSFSRQPSFANNTFIETPISAFLSYFPHTRFTLYGQGEYWSGHREEAFSHYFLQLGGGGKYQIIPNVLEVELLYTYFLAGSLNQGAGQTYNLGLRYIR